MERRIINPWTWQDRLGFVQANELRGAQRFLICSGQASIDADGGIVHIGDMAGQINQALNNLETVLKEAGFSMSDIVSIRTYTTDVRCYMESGGAIGKRLTESGSRVSATLIGVASLAFPELLVEIEAVAAA